jgi:hypothetical protein
MEFGEFALSIIAGLVTNVVQAGVNYAVLPFFERRKIERRVEDATAEVVEPLLPFLSQEGIPEDKQRRLIQTCVDELRPLTQKPELLFQGSLNGQKIFDDLYANRDLPQTVIEDGLKDTYALLCPRIATLLCKIPAAVKDWENEAWTENYRRLDEITGQMRNLFSRVDRLATLPSSDADETLTIVRRALAQKIGFELDLTGLRADRPLAGRFDDFFVHPEIKNVAPDNQLKIVLNTSDESFKLFTRRYHQNIIIGPPGAGKSTWAKWLQRETLSDRWTGISIRVELRRFSNAPLLSLHELVREAAGKHLAEELTAERIGRWLEANQIVFILDGFDEIRPGERDKVYDWIVELQAAARGCPFVLTSRPLTTGHLDRLSIIWQLWTIEPFNETRIIDYIQRWYKNTPVLLDGNREVDAASLAATWSSDPTIGPLTGNPLLLSTVLMVHHLDGSLPSGRSQLYRRYVEGMLGLWDDRRQVAATTVQLSLEQKRQIVRGFALYMFLRGEDQLDETVTLDWLQGFLQRINISLPGEDVLAVLRERSGLIVGPGIYSFAHKSIAEYLVAETILQGDQRDESGRRIDRFLLFEYRDDDRWNTVTFLWAGLAPITDVESFMDACNEVKAWALAYGILYDQYERIPKETRRQLLLQAIYAKQIPIQLKAFSYWVVSYFHNVADAKLPIPSFGLRLLTPHQSFKDILYNATSDGTLVWSDILKSSGEMRDLLWMHFVISPQSINELKTLLEMPGPENGSSSLWLFWVGERLFISILRNNLALDVQDTLKTYKETCPHVKGFVPLLLMTIGIILVRRDFRDQNQLANESIYKLLEILPGSNESQVMPDWLLGTHEWVLGFGRSFNERIGDLLKVFIEEMERLVKEGMLKRDETYERAIGFVEKLREQRDALEPPTA